MEIKQQFLTQNDCYKEGRYITPIGIMVHSTGANNPNLRRYLPGDELIGYNAYGNHWNTTGLEVCVHGFVGKDANGDVQIYQTLPWDMRGWHAGGLANDTHISFEICEDGLDNEDYFWTVCGAAAWLCAKLCIMYNLDPSTVICHSEGYKLGIASNHADVMHWFSRFGRSMDDLRWAIGQEIAKQKAADKTEIMGEPTATAEQMILFCSDSNPNPQLPNCTIEELVQMFLEEGRAEGVRGDIAFAQSLKETGFFRYGGIVTPDMNNFAGIGALNNNSKGQAAKFTDPRAGIRAQIQHLKAYASTDALINPCVDPRFNLVTRGAAPYVEWLGAADNPKGRGWAYPGEGYGASVVSILQKIISQMIPKPEKTEAEIAMSWMIENGYFTEERPNDTITRGDFAITLYRQKGKQT